MDEPMSASPSLKKKIPFEKLTSTGLGKATGDPSVSGQTSKQLCLWRLTNAAFRLNGCWCCIGMDVGGGRVAEPWVSGFPKNPWLVSDLSFKSSGRFAYHVSKENTFRKKIP